jgi:hypothetical protein
MMDVPIETHVSLEPKNSPPTHNSKPNNVSKDNQVQGLSKAQGLKHPQVPMYAIVFSNPLILSVHQVSLDSHFPMDVKFLERANVSMEDPSLINLEYSLDQSQ